MQQNITKVIHNTIDFLVSKNLFDKAILDNKSFNVAVPTNKNFGDYSSNIAMVLAKDLRKNPKEIAALIIENLQDKNNLIKEANIAHPGFINITVNNQALYQTIFDVLKLKHSYGYSEKNNKKVLIEFVSANPTGPLHGGHARGAYVGDVLSKIFKAAGYHVDKEFYVNDYGNQVNILAGSVYNRYLQLFDKEVETKQGQYPGEYIKDIAAFIKEKDGDKWLNKDENETLKYFKEIAIEKNLENIKNTLNNLGITFDKWFFESNLHSSGKVEKLIKQYDDLGLLYQAKKAKQSNNVRREGSNAAKFSDLQKGGTYLKTAQFGDEEDRILIKASGEVVYLAADLAYHKDKFDRNYDLMIDLFGADHANHIQRISSSMKALGYDDDKLKFLLVQIVKLLKDGREIKFSKRKGDIYTLTELVDEIGKDAARFIFLMRAPNSQFEFNLDVLKEQNESNPVYYLQYGYARMATLLKKAKQNNCPFVGIEKLNKDHLEVLQLPEERDLLKKMSDFNKIICQSAQSMQPHQLLYYCQELIACFHRYFTKYKNSHKIISDNQKETQSRLALVAALKQVLHNAFSLMGVTAFDSM